MIALCNPILHARPKGMCWPGGIGTTRKGAAYAWPIGLVPVGSFAGRNSVVIKTPFPHVVADRDDAEARVLARAFDLSSFGYFQRGTVREWVRVHPRV